MHKKYKISILVLISLLIVSNLNQVWGCIGGDFVDIDNMSMIYPDLMKQDDLRIYLPSFHLYNAGYEQTERLEIAAKDEDSRNIDEWFQHFGKKYDKKFLNELIYKDSSVLVQKFIENQPKELAEDFNYILFARRVSDSVNIDVNRWWYEKKQPVNYTPLIEVAETRFGTTKNSFIKFRYGYLVQKLLHATGKYEEAASWYENNLSTAGLTGTIKYRTLDYYAGALYHLKKYESSNYLFSRIFDEYPAREYTSYFNFRPQEEKDWQGALAMAKNDHERETLWFLFGLHADIVKAMQNIYQLNPSSRYLELLVMRSVKMVENSTPEIWKNSGTPDEYNGGEYGPNGNYYVNNTDTFYIQNIYGNMATAGQAEKEQLAAFITAHADENKIQNKWLWNIAAAYLDLINHQYDKAELLLQLAEKNSGADTLKTAQANILRLVLKLKTVTTITPQVESELLKLLVKLPHHAGGGYADANAFSFCMSVLKQDYLQQRDSLKAALCDAGDLSYFKSDPAKRLAEAEHLFRRPDTTAFENYLVRNYAYTVNQLIYAQGIHKFYQYDFEGAERDFSRFWQTFETLPADPFTNRINDCHDCDQGAKQKTNYNMLSLVKKIIELKRFAESSKKTKDKSRNYLLLANALYNTGYFGNDRVATTTFLYNGYQNLYGEFYDYNEPGAYMPWHEKTYTDCSEAEKYYTKALQYATDDETKAMCTWMIAKCQLNNFYSTKAYRSGSTDFFASRAYHQMKDNYSKTLYYKEVINECEYFTSYLGLPKKIKKE